MSQWTIQIEPTADGRFQWRHVPAEGTGTGTAHVGGDHYDTPEAARAAGEEALARHHEKALKDSAGTPPDAEEDPRLKGESPVSMSSLPVEAQIRTADEEGTGLTSR